MKTKLIKLSNNSAYMINIPETASEGIISLQDRIILDLLNKLKLIYNENTITINIDTDYFNQF